MKAQITGALEQAKGLNGKGDGSEVVLRCGQRDDAHLGGWVSLQVRLRSTVTDVCLRQWKSTFIPPLLLLL